MHTSRQLNGVQQRCRAIIRYRRGRMVKALTGTMKGLSPLATQLWAIHMGLNQARHANCEIVMLKTDNFISTPILRLRVRMDEETGHAHG